MTKGESEILMCIRAMRVFFFLAGGGGQMYELYDPCTVMFFYR